MQIKTISSLLEWLLIVVKNVEELQTQTLSSANVNGTTTLENHFGSFLKS